MTKVSKMRPLITYWSTPIGVFCATSTDPFEWGPYEDVEHVRLAMKWRFKRDVDLQPRDERMTA